MSDEIETRDRAKARFADVLGFYRANVSEDIAPDDALFGLVVYDAFCYARANEIPIERLIAEAREGFAEYERDAAAQAWGDDDDG